MGNLLRRSNNLELYLNDVYKKECMFKASKKEVEFVQTGIETLVQKIVDLVIDYSLPRLVRQFNKYMTKKKVVEVYFNLNKKEHNSKVKIARSEIIKVGSFYEGTKNNFPDEFDFIFPLYHVQVQRSFLFYNKPSISHSNIEKVTRRNKRSLIFISYGQCTVTRILHFDQYLQEHGPASTLRFIYTNSSGDRRNIHVDLVPAYKVTSDDMEWCLEHINMDRLQLEEFPRSLSTEILLKETCLKVSRNYSFTETEVHFMKNVLSEKHRKVYRILKFLINGHSDGEILTLIFPNRDISSYQIKMVVIHHHDECTNPNTGSIGVCVINILIHIHIYKSRIKHAIYHEYLDLIKPCINKLIQSLGALQATEDTYSYDQVTTKSLSRQFLDGIDRDDPNNDFWFRNLDTLDGDDPRMDSFEEFLDDEIPGWRERREKIGMSVSDQFQFKKEYSL